MVQEPGSRDRADKFVVFVGKQFHKEKAVADVGVLPVGLALDNSGAGFKGFCQSGSKDTGGFFHERTS